MRKLLLSILLVLSIAPFAHASNVGVSVGVNIGGPSAAYVDPPVVISGPPLFLYPPRLGFYVAVGVGYDLFLSGNVYYLNSGNVWYSSPYYNGPWAKVHYKKVPYGIRKHDFKQIHYYRDDSYRKYKAGKASHRYKHFKPQAHSYHADGYGKKGGRNGNDNHGYSDKGNKNEKGGNSNHAGGGHGKGHK
jgi:hypothetical protein